VDQFKSGLFPPGQIILYHQDFNLKRVTAEESRHNDRIAVDTLQSARHGAEVHRQVRKFMQSYIKPGLLMTDICETLEGLSRKLVKENGLHAGIAFPTGCSLNNVAAHYTPNTGDTTRLTAADVMKIDFGVHVNGRIIDCAWTWAPDPKFKPLLDAVQDSTDTGIRTAGIDVRLCDVGAAVEEVMESYEIELDKKRIKIKTVRNLNGHSIDPYKIHGPKCLGRDTPVLMLDGSVKPVQDVVVGDRLMGDDGTERRVLATTAGRAVMYEIASVHSAPFTCNGAHILSLRLANLPACTERADGTHVVAYAAVQRHADGTVSDFQLCEYVCPNAADARDAMVQLDCGTLDIAVNDIAKMDADKQSRLRLYRIAQPLKFVPEQPPHNDTFDAHKDASIPASLKRGSVAAREALLDAIVDARGKRNAAGGATIVVMSAALCDDIEFVARSLGRFVTRAETNPYGPAHTLYVARDGNANEEPLAIAVLLGDDEYFGFAIDGNHRFVLGHSFVVTHNSVPNVRGGDTTRMEEGEFYAIETFGSTGKGHVVEDGECSHFMKSFDAVHVPIRMTKAKQLLGHINRSFDTLAFCRRWLDRAGQTQYIMALKNLCDLGIVNKYPPLVDRKGSYVAQFEHTIFLRPTCKEVVSRGDDY
jgi:methionine aminopeptidase